MNDDVDPHSRIARLKGEFLADHGDPNPAGNRMWDASSFYQRTYSDGSYENWDKAPGKEVIINGLRGVLDEGCIARSARIVDIGCGIGYLLQRFREEISAEFELWGIDVSSEAISIGRRRFPDLSPKLIAGNGAHTPFEDGFLDVLVSYGAYEHFQNPRLALAEGSRILRSNGYFFMMMPTLGIYRRDRDDEGWYEELKSSAKHEPLQMQWNWRRSTWQQILSDASLECMPVDVSMNHGAINPGVFFFGKKRG